MARPGRRWTTVTSKGKRVKVGMNAVRGHPSGLLISRVTGFDDVFGGIRRCPGLKTRIVGAQTRRFDLPRSCVKIRGRQPGQVRVSVFGSGARGLGDFHPGDSRLLGFVEHD